MFSLKLLKSKNKELNLWKKNLSKFDYRFFLKIILFIIYIFFITLTIYTAGFKEHWFKNNQFDTYKIEYEDFWNIEGIISFFPFQIALFMTLYYIVGIFNNKLEGNSFFYSNRFKNILIITNLFSIFISIFEISAKSYFYLCYESQKVNFIFIIFLAPILSIFYCLFTPNKSDNRLLKNFLIDNFIFLTFILIHLSYSFIRKELIDLDNKENKTYLISSFYSFMISHQKFIIFIILSLCLISIFSVLLFSLEKLNTIFYKILKRFYKIDNFRFDLKLKINKKFYKSFSFYLKTLLFTVYFFDTFYGFYKDCFAGEYWYVVQGSYTRYWNAEGLLSFYSIQVSIITMILLFFSIIFHKNDHNNYFLKYRFKAIVLSWNLVMLFIFWAGILSTSNIKGGFSEYSTTQISLSIISHLICPTILTIYFMSDSGYEKIQWKSISKREFFWVISYPIFYSIYVLIRAKAIESEKSLSTVPIYYYDEFMDFNNPPLLKKNHLYILFFYIIFTILYISIYSIFIVFNNLIYKTRKANINYIKIKKKRLN